MREFKVEGPFPNPHWVNADDEDKHLHDRWSYSINGHSFSHPTLNGAKRMMEQPERHTSVIDRYPPDTSNA